MRHRYDCVWAPFTTTVPAFALDHCCYDPLILLPGYTPRYDQTLVWSKGFGLKNRSDVSSQPDADSIYRIGSISKIFAMLSTMITRDAGKLSLDDDVAKYVPEFSVKPAPSATAKRRRDATVRDNERATGRTGITFSALASHLAGLSRESPCTGFPDGGQGRCDMTDAEAWARVANTTAILPPNTMPIYSNMGFEVLGHAVAAIHGMSYEAMVAALLTGPLNLTHTGVNFTADVMRESSPLFPHLALPYQEGMTPCGTPCLQDFGWGNPSGAMFSSVRDLAKICSLMFHGDDSAHDGDASPILSATSLRETMLPKYITPDRTGGYATTWELYQIVRCAA